MPTKTRHKTQLSWISGMDRDDQTSPETPLLATQRQQQAELRPNRIANAISIENGHQEGVTPLDTESGGDSDSDGSRRRRRLSFYYSRSIATLTSVFVDDEGTGWPVVFGLLMLVVLGTILGSVLPGDADLPAGWYRFSSNAIGYTYFMSWSVSFYPQVISNFRRKSTLGLSPDFCGLNVIGFGCYMIYNVGMYWSSTIQKQYHQRHGEDSAISVQSNDVAFAIHAFCLASITLFQIGYYNGFQGSQSPSKVILSVAALFLGTAAVMPILVLATTKIEWLDYLYLLGNIKVAITLMKYIPQVILNYKRQSTVGWSIWNIILDFTGGTLSDLQLVLDCAALHDWTGITGNLTKLALGSVSVIFDVIFMTQHYILYRGDHRNNGNNLQQVASSSDHDYDNMISTDSVQGEPLAAIDELNL